MAADDMSPTARSLRTLELLQIRPGITGAALAERLGITDRAARRHVAILREAGVPIDSDRGRHGGYRLGRGLRQPPLVFTATEAVGLVMAVLDGHHAASDPDDSVGSALDKLIRSLPGNIARHADTIRHHALAAPDRRAVRADPTMTISLVDAIEARQRIHIWYRTGTGSAWEADVDPWAIVVRHGRWYLLCVTQPAASGRVLRIDRIEQLETLMTTCEPRPDSDPVTWLEQHMSTGWDYDAHVVFDAPIEDVAPFVGPPMGRLEAIDDGRRCRLVGTTSNPDMYAGEWLAAIPHPFAVHGGPELRNAVTKVGQRMIAAATPELP